MYARVEFRRHKDCDPKFIPEFMNQWNDYYKSTKAFVDGTSLPQQLTTDQLDQIATNTSQTEQLYDLMMEAKNNSMLLKKTVLHMILVVDLLIRNKNSFIYLV